eukprot:m51a1_g7653 hypothetical protein (172) ;mRNA; f:392301-392866
MSRVRLQQRASDDDGDLKLPQLPGSVCGTPPRSQPASERRGRRRRDNGAPLASGSLPAIAPCASAPSTGAKPPAGKRQSAEAPRVEAEAEIDLCVVGTRARVTRVDGELGEGEAVEEVIAADGAEDPGPGDELCVVGSAVSLPGGAGAGRAEVVEETLVADGAPVVLDGCR